MAGKSIYNWEALRRAYVTGEGTLRELSQEHTGLESSPKYQTIRKAAFQQDWEGQRQAFVNNLSTQTAATPTAQQVVQQTVELINSGETILRHIQIAKSLQGMSAVLQKKLSGAIAQLQPSEIEKLSPRQMTLLLKDLAGILAIATELERKAMGIPEPEQQVNVTFDVTHLSDVELHRIASQG